LFVGRNQQQQRSRDRTQHSRLSVLSTNGLGRAWQLVTELTTECIELRSPRACAATSWPQTLTGQPTHDPQHVRCCRFVAGTATQLERRRRSTGIAVALSETNSHKPRTPVRSA